MNTVDFNKIRLVAGVRFEGTNLDTAAPIFDADGNFVGMDKRNGSYVKVERLSRCLADQGGTSRDCKQPQV